MTIELADDILELRDLLERSVSELDALDRRAQVRRTERSRSMRDHLSDRLGQSVEIAALDGSRHRGVVRRVGLDHVVMDTAAGTVLTALFPIVTVRDLATDKGEL